MKNVFDQNDTAEIIQRINRLTPDTQRLWGKMTVAQMLAHCNVSYEQVYDDTHPKPGGIKRFLLKSFVKKIVVSETPFKKNSPTAPHFVMKNDKDFEAEKKRLIDHVQKTQQLGAAHFEGKSSHSFGVLTITEWNNMFAKHLDHHLRQFGG